MTAKKEINSYSIFRIPRSETTSLKTHLIKGNLTFQSKKTISGYTFSFYFSEKPPLSPVHWLDLYKDFFPKKGKKYNQVYFGVLIIQSKNTATYAISLGKAHFYVERYADKNFGLDLAQRIADPSALRKKLTKYFFSNKNHSLITFRQGSNVDDYESGEYYQDLTSSTISEARWGKTVSFGNNILLKLPITPIELNIVIKRIESELKKQIRVGIPRVELIKDSKLISKLEKSLTTSLIHFSSKKVDNKTILSSKDFLISDNIKVSIFLTGHKSKLEILNEFNVPNVLSFVKKYKIDISKNLDNLNIIIEPEGDLPIKNTLRHYLDYVDDNGCCLLDGKWHKFNSSYTEYLQRYVASIDFEYDSNKDFDNGDFKKYLSKNPKSYAEEYFNKLREKEGFINKDRDILLLKGKYKVEYLDLYLRGCIYFVKIGKPQKLSYVIDQAINTLQLLRNKTIKIKIKDSYIRPKKICLWVILERNTIINKLSDIDSLIFHMKLTEWIRLAKSLKIEPLININYRN